MLRTVALLSIVARCAAFGTFRAPGDVCIDEPAHVIAEETAKMGENYTELTSCDAIAEAGGCDDPYWEATVQAACCASCALPQRESRSSVGVQRRRGGFDGRTEGSKSTGGGRCQRGTFANVPACNFCNEYACDAMRCLLLCRKDEWRGIASSYACEKRCCSLGRVRLPYVEMVGCIRKDVKDAYPGDWYELSWEEQVDLWSAAVDKWEASPAACHPASSIVELADGRALRIDQTKEGDLLHTPSGPQPIVGCAPPPRMTPPRALRPLFSPSHAAPSLPLPAAQLPPLREGLRR